MTSKTEVKTWTEDEISKAVNTGADVVLETINTGERDADLVNLVVNAALTRLRNPEASFADVAHECYSEEPSVILGWWDFGG